MSEEEPVVIIQEENFICPICFCDVEIVDVFTLKQCGCSFCKSCLSKFTRLNINGRTIHRLICPTTHIKNFVFERDEIKKLVDHEEFLSYLRQKHEDLILQDPNRIFCPRSDCGAVCYSKRLGPRPVRCMTCGLKFCRLCHSVWPGRSHTCPEDFNLMTPSRQETTEELLNQEDTPSVVATEATAKMVEPSPKQQKLEITRCPKCGVAIEKVVGCPQMRCSRCGHSFCWFCLNSLDYENYLQHVMHGKCSATASQQSENRLRRCMLRFRAVGRICSLGVVCMICSPFIILCSPCIVAEEYMQPFGPPNLRKSDLNEGDTDSEKDDEVALQT